jgi:hypothetical protein
MEISVWWLATGMQMTVTVKGSLEMMLVMVLTITFYKPVAVEKEIDK